MRRLAALVLIVFAVAAHAADAPRRITVVAQPARRAAPEPARPAPAVPASGFASAPVLWTQSGVDGAACRTTCAQTRYFCEADPNADDCGAAWSQCVASCGAPALNSASTAAAGTN
jgi:hypothetical protein